jgi:Tfp pilus assembly protein PilO
MDIKLGNLKVSLAIIITIVVQAAGLIWYVSSLDSQMKTNATQIEELKEAHTIKINDLETRHNIAIEKVASDLEKYQTLDGVMLSQLEERLAETEQVQRVIDNEMRTIMSDHSGFNDVLKELNKAGLLPSGEKREYGGYY